MKRVQAHEGMTGAELREWRLSQPGQHKIRTKMVDGWSQAQAGQWYGCADTTWSAYERGVLPIPLPLIKRMIGYRLSLDDILNRLWKTPKNKVEEWRGPNPGGQHDPLNVNRIK